MGVGVGVGVGMVKDAWSAIEAHRKSLERSTRPSISRSLLASPPPPPRYISTYHVKISHIEPPCLHFRRVDASVKMSRPPITNHYLQRCGACPINPLLLCGHKEQTTNEPNRSRPSLARSLLHHRQDFLTPPPPLVLVLVLVISDSGVCHAG